ncbi:hypothetical protein [uncultured Algoriphagus sp.]|uniref:hypothetical protein n=1 Tax=uncultured Algoriphagus sp. TaxID=417365 RepID=UPI0030EEAAEF|tara:strand:- start:169 stop:807 length:639 start_codon:yes stop_codon:yes gene_type:complete
MKKSISEKLGMITLAGSVLMVSCSPLIEESIDPQLVKSSEALVVPGSSGDLNARKSTEVAYFERFTNQLTQLDEHGNWTAVNPTFFPGTGIGNSSHMGKALTFLNQRTDRLGTVGAPVTQFYSEQLEALGIFVDNLEVSSVTTDGKGNSVWFKNIQNIASPISEERIEFKAEVEIIGGTGKFEGASGSATVDGFFNPTNGQGMSTIKGNMLY